MSELLAPERVAYGVPATSRKRALELAAHALAGGANDPGESVILDSLLGRERLGSTAIGYGVALPHGRVDGLAQSRGAFIRLAQPVDFDAADGVPVDLVFGLIVPLKCDDEHLAALATIAARFDDAELRDALRATRDPMRALKLLEV
ncbi:MAG: PTS sugar transporter subunit IIA [Gammaproteobacteria bacterium]